MYNFIFLFFSPDAVLVCSLPLLLGGIVFYTPMYYICIYTQYCMVLHVCIVVVAFFVARCTFFGIGARTTTTVAKQQQHHQNTAKRTKNMD